MQYKVSAKALRTLGQNVSRLRRAVNLSQDALAEKADLTKRYVQVIESGQRCPTLATLKRLQAALGCAYGDLLDGF